MPPRDPADRDDQPMSDDDLDVDLAALRGGGGDADLDHLGRVARSLTRDDLERDEPPSAVWEGILARTSGQVAGDPGRPAGVESRGEHAAVPAPGPVPPTAAPGEGAGPPLTPIEGERAAEPPRPPAHIAPRRQPWRLLAAAAAVVVVLVAAGVALLRDGAEAPPVLASAQLEPLPDEPTGAATPVIATVVESDGGLELDLSTAGLPAPDGFYEVWLIDTNVEGMVSLGPARADGTYAVPSDVDPAAFPIVDVSIEQPDGNPAHSGVSVLRGVLS